MSSDPLKKARGIAYRLLGMRARTVQQIRDRLIKKEIPEDITVQVIDELVEAGYVDDLAFARNYIEYRLRGKPYGPYWLRSSLLRTGVARELIDTALSEVFVPGREEELAQLYLSQIYQRSEMPTQKAMRRLLARGFSRQAAFHALRDIIEVN
ncbi:MAG: recombination regulator RecX [Firmicutes bacterium]|nr:recombination regulator RecX [Bacillota bacterium]